ncbi:MAG TPA: chemotaxis protein CheB [Pyrinomonadaceae bacterium]|jgi:two-component system chemotaxis response regulator CheB
MPGRDIVVVGTSAGGVEALRALVGGLPADFPGSVFVVMHTAPDSPGVLAHILDRSGPLPAANATNRERIRPGRVYVAPPDTHLLLEPGVVRLTRGPKENRFRPAVDPLFRSAAAVYGPRVVGVILTGGLDDGTSGLWAVKRLGGAAVVQDPDEAFMPSMPLSALGQVEVDHTLRVAEIAPLLVQLARTTVAEQGDYEVPEKLNIEVKIAMEDHARESGVARLGTPSIFTCPECHGTLLQLKENGRTRFRCHTGHAYSADSLLSEMTESVEETLWSAIRNIDESAMLMRHMAEHIQEADGGAASRFMEKARDAERRSEIVRRAVFDHENLSEEKLAAETAEVPGPGA